MLTITTELTVFVLLIIHAVFGSDELIMISYQLAFNLEAENPSTNIKEMLIYNYRDKVT